MDIGKMLYEVRGSASLLDCDGLLIHGRHCDELDVQMSVSLKLGCSNECVVEAWFAWREEKMV